VQEEDAKDPDEGTIEAENKVRLLDAALWTALEANFHDIIS
jgi:hypothetical protein